MDNDKGEPALPSNSTSRKAIADSRCEELLDAALQYAHLDWHVFPLKGKIPVIKGGYKSASSDIEQIRRWWTHDHPGANIGVACNHIFWALDVDSKSAGFDTLRDLEKKFGPLPITMTSRTGGGGKHLLFRHNGTAIKNAAHTAGPGLDTRSDGYIVLPPSVHPDTGMRYEWELAEGECGADIVDAPEWLTNLCRKNSKGIRPGKAPPSHIGHKSNEYWRTALETACGGILAAANGQQEQTLNTTSFHIGRLVAGGQLSRDAATSALVQAGQAMISHDSARPWTSEEIEAKVESALDDGEKEPLPDLSRDTNGSPYKSQNNIRLAIALLGAKVSHDIFNDNLMIDGIAGFGPVLDDAALTALWLHVDEQFQFRPPKEFFRDVVENEARRNSIHPVQNYLDGLTWDGTHRLDKWLVTYGEADDSEYVHAISALMMIAAVRRVRRPGCKFDEMLILESEQGTNKSTALQVMAVNDDWFSDDLPLGQDAQRTIERTRGKWLVEAGELRGMRKGEVESLKAFLSRAVDRARPAYGRLPLEVRRQFVIFGTTNSERYLRDVTGNRRFWPVTVQGFDIEKLKRDRDQLWAEAAAREEAGESIRLDSQLWAKAAEEQVARHVEDPFAEAIRATLADLEGKLLCEEAWKILGIPPGQRTQEHNNRLGESMKVAGWFRKKLRHRRIPKFHYVKGDESRRILISPDGIACYEKSEDGEEPM